MADFMLSEQRALELHHAILETVQDHPNLIGRARRRLAALRESRGDLALIWEKWTDILDRPAEDMGRDVLADTPDGGLLRAHSPLDGMLSPEERNALWQRVGLRRFFRFFMDAADDMALSEDEQASLAGQDLGTLAGWRESPPRTMTRETLERLKRVVSVHITLKELLGDMEGRRNWLREESATLGARPIDLLMGDGIERLRDYLSGARRLRLKPGDMPVF